MTEMLDTLKNLKAQMEAGLARLQTYQDQMKIVHRRGEEYEEKFKKMIELHATSVESGDARVIKNTRKMLDGSFNDFIGVLEATGPLTQIKKDAMKSVSEATDALAKITRDNLPSDMTSEEQGLVKEIMLMMLDTAIDLEKRQVKPKTEPKEGKAKVLDLLRSLGADIPADVDPDSIEIVGGLVGGDEPEPLPAGPAMTALMKAMRGKKS